MGVISYHSDRFVIYQTKAALSALIAVLCQLNESSVETQV